MLKENICTNFAPTFVDQDLLPNMNFNGHRSLKKKFPSQKIGNLYSSYTLIPWLRNLNTDFIIDNCLFGFVKLTKNADPDKYRYSDYDIGFDLRLEFSLPDGRIGRNFLIFEADMSLSVHAGNKQKDILILGEGLTQALDDTILTSEAKYPINFTQPNKRFALPLTYNGINSFC